MPGREGIDYFVGDHRQMAVDDCRKRAEEYRTGKRTPTSDDLRCAQMKVLDGGYPYWEEELARAVLAAGRQTNPNLELPNSVAEIRRYYGISW